MELRTVKAVVTGGASGLGEPLQSGSFAAGASALLDRCRLGGCRRPRTAGQAGNIHPSA